MSEENESEKSIRRLLLGESGEEEQQRVEERFMTDPEYRERVLMAENDLIEDYLEGALSEGERKRFRTHFLSTPRQLRKVKLARSLRNYAAVEVTAHSPPADAEDPQRVPKPRRLFEALRLRWLFDAQRLRSPVVYLPLAVALVVAVVFGSWRLVEFRRAQQLRARAESQRLEVERELAQLNDPSSAGRPQPVTGVFSMALPPVTVRGAANRLSPPDETGVVELWLLRAGDEYQNYRATLQKVGTASRFSITNLRAADTPGGRAVPVKIPAHLLTPGVYRLTLSGLTADGRPEEAGEYTFQRD
jgi:anti-sigma factor RsiW